jgi:hypothetical protein
MWGISDCGCEERRMWLKQNTPTQLHGFVDSLDLYDFFWDVTANITAVVVLYLFWKMRRTVA